MTFRTYMDYGVNASDAANLSVLGNAGVLVDGDIFVNVTGFDYVDGNWTFQVANANPFDVTFDWSAWTRYLLYAESPAIDVGDDGSVEWQGSGISGATPLELTDGVQRVVDATNWPLTEVDLFGNLLYRVPINFTSTSKGDLALRNVVVLWNGSITTPDLSEDVDSLKADLPTDADGFVNITINVTSQSAGSLHFTSVDVLYDLPPYSLPFPDVIVPEDEVSPPLDLDTVIFDDHDNNDLEYEVVRESGDANVSFNLSDEDAVTFRGPANWSGAAVFHVVAVDSSNLTYRTNPFNVTIEAVEDPPLIHGLRETYVVYFGVERTVRIDIEDNDSDLSEMGITTGTSRVWGDVENGTLHFLYPFSSVNETVEVNISDGEAWSVYSINVTPEESNEPPVIDFPGEFAFNISLDAQGILDLGPYASDLESDRDDLVWSLVDSAEDLVVMMNDGRELQVIPVATQGGDRTIELSCEDPDGNVAYGNLTVRLRTSDSHPPIILRGEDALPLIVRVEVDGKAEINLPLQKYWYDQEDFNQPHLLRWEVESLRPSLFTVELDQNDKLTIKAFGSQGSGYFTIRLFDSDNEFSSTESVQVEVVKKTDESPSWLMFAVVAVILILVVVGLMAASRGKGGDRERPKPASKAAPAREERRREPEPEPEPAPADEGPEQGPTAQAPGRILQLLVVHENTSLITQMGGDRDDQLPPEREDDLIEMSTLFGQERFEDASVGTIKAFKFNGEEVLVGKGRDYFLVARCSGTEFEGVAHEIKRSIVNIDVNMADKIRDWYPGQTISPLEEELRELLSEGAG